MTNCIFCKIIQGEIPCYKVFENDHCLAFLDISPCTKGHTVVIPKTHGETVFDVDNETSYQVMETTKQTMHLLQTKLQPDGFNVGWNHNKAGGQAVPHLHIHILPRYDGDKGGSMHSIVNHPTATNIETIAKLFEQQK